MSLLLTLLGALAIEVVGPSTCPAPADVTTELSRMSASASGGENAEGRGLVAEIRRATPPLPGPATETVPLVPVDPRLFITLRRTDGALLAERIVTESGSCAELAAAAAVVIAAWQGGLRPDLGPELPRSLAGASRTTANSTRPNIPGTTANAPVATAVATAAPATTANGAIAAAERNGGSAGTASSVPVEVGVAALATAAGDVVPGLRADAVIGALGWGLAPRLAGVIEVPHQLALGPSPGTAVWSRTSVAVGLRKRAAVGRFTLDGQGHFMAGLVRMHGSGFDNNYASSALDLGAGVGVQLGWPRRWLAPFLGLGASLWPSRTTVAATGTLAEATLPSFDAYLALGVSVGRFQ